MASRLPARATGSPSAARDALPQEIEQEGQTVLDMTAEDYESVARASRDLHARGWRTEFTLNQMLDAWAYLVAEVESGYHQDVYEYTDDLCCRDWLALAWPMFTENVRLARAEELRVLDQRFSAATIDDGGLAIGRRHRIGTSDGWWWGRTPVKSLGQFSRDLAQG